MKLPNAIINLQESYVCMLFACLVFNYSKKKMDTLNARYGSHIFRTLFKYDY